MKQAPPTPRATGLLSPLCCLSWEVRSTSAHHSLKPSSPDRQGYKEVTDGHQFAKEFAAELAASRFGEAGSSLSPAGHPMPTGAAAHALPSITLPAALAGARVRPHVSLEEIREKARAPGRLRQKSVSMDNVGDALTVHSTPSCPFCTGRHRFVPGKRPTCSCKRGRDAGWDGGAGGARGRGVSGE